MYVCLDPGEAAPDIPQYCIDYFKLKSLENQQEQEELSDSLRLYKSRK